MAIEITAVSDAYVALLREDLAALAEVVADDASIAVPGNDGSGADHLANLMTAANSRGLRTWSDDSADVLASEYHAVVLDRWLADGDGGLDQHMTVLFADRREVLRHLSVIHQTWATEGAPASRVTWD